MNSVRTPQLEAVVTSSDDYISNNSRASSGFSPIGFKDDKFKINGD